MATIIGLLEVAFIIIAILFSFAAGFLSVPAARQFTLRAYTDKLAIGKFRNEHVDMPSMIQEGMGDKA